MPQMFGRRMIFTDADSINESNVVHELYEALETHEKNSAQTNYLERYYRGSQPIWEKTKEVRPEINHKICVNRAYEIVTFKKGYTVGEPIQYICRSGRTEDASEITRLNEFMFTADKQSGDDSLFEWDLICGTAYRLVRPRANDSDKSEAPFEIFTLDPRCTFVVYSGSVDHRPMMAVTYVTLNDEKHTRVFSVYTDNMQYTIKDGKISDRHPFVPGTNAIIEYPANSQRLGSFEVVVPLLDAINSLESDRADAVTGFVDSLMVFKGVDIETEDFEQLKRYGGIKIPMDGEVDYLVQELNQTQTQTFVDDLYTTVLTICGMPNRNGGSSTSDTGSAVILRDGWSAAEARAKADELAFKRSEKQFLRVILNICGTMRDMNLSLSAIDIKFTRRIYGSTNEKVQNLTAMLSSDKIHPRLAFEQSELFPDPDIAYEMSREYSENEKNEAAAELAEYEKALAAAEELKANGSSSDGDIADDEQDDL